MYFFLNTIYNVHYALVKIFKFVSAESLFAHCSLSKAQKSIWYSSSINIIK